jgi:hypothetical protein
MIHDIQHNNTRNNDTQHNDKNVTLSIMMKRVVMLIVIYGELRYPECRDVIERKRER